jgi:hypothetical protein
MTAIEKLMDVIETYKESMLEVHYIDAMNSLRDLHNAPAPAPAVPEVQTEETIAVARAMRVLTTCLEQLSAEDNTEVFGQLWDSLPANVRAGLNKHLLLYRAFHNMEAIELLLRFGANPDIHLEAIDNTAMSIAYMRGDMRLINILSLHSNSEYIDREGHSYFYWVCRSGLAYVIRECMHINSVRLDFPIQAVLEGYDEETKEWRQYELIEALEELMKIGYVIKDSDVEHIRTFIPEDKLTTLRVRGGDAGLLGLPLYQFLLDNVVEEGHE